MPNAKNYRIAGCLKVRQDQQWLLFRRCSRELGSLVNRHDTPAEVLQTRDQLRPGEQFLIEKQSQRLRHGGRVEQGKVNCKKFCDIAPALTQTKISDAQAIS